MHEAYRRSIDNGELSPLVNFRTYVETSNKIDNELIGESTSNGIKITGKSEHFVARVLGSVEQHRNGVEIDDIRKVLMEPDIIYPEESRNGKISQKFAIKGIAAVTINPETGNLIQTNPLK